MQGRQLSTPAPLSQPPHLQLEQSLEGRRHFLCPSPISMPNPKDRRLHGWEGAWKRGQKDSAPRRLTRWEGSLCLGSSHLGIRQAHGTH